MSFYTLKIIYRATYLGSIFYSAPVWADSAAIGAIRLKLLHWFSGARHKKRLTLALPKLAGVLPVDFNIRRRAAMYYSILKNM